MTYRSERLMVDIKLLCRNNAGKFSHKLEFSEDKIEMTFATNYLGKIFLLCYYVIGLNIREAITMRSGSQWV